MFDVGLGEVIALAVIALIVFGPDHRVWFANIAAHAFFKRPPQLMMSSSVRWQRRAGVRGVPIRERHLSSSGAAMMLFIM